MLRCLFLWNGDLVGIFGCFRFFLFLGVDGGGGGFDVVEVA